MKHLIFHHDDLDGYCAGAAIPLLMAAEDEFEAYAVNYNRPFPMDKIHSGDIVWILDYSVSIEQMDEIISKVGLKNLHWIDHHRTAFERFSHYDKQIQGIRTSAKSGCVLTWAYIQYSNWIGWNNQYPEYDAMMKEIFVPMFATLIGDMDTWTWEYKEQTEHFVGGMKTYPHTSPFSDIWRDLYQKTISINEVCNRGEIVGAYCKEHYQRRLKAWGFECEFEGQTIICMNDKDGSWVFGDYFDKYPFVSTFIWDGETYNISLYSKPGPNQVDVGRIAEQWCGGGGHPGAAGFACNVLPYKNMRKIDWETM